MIEENIIFPDDIGNQAVIQEFYNTPLINASSQGYTDIDQLLLAQKGIDVNRENILDLKNIYKI